MEELITDFCVYLHSNTYTNWITPGRVALHAVTAIINWLAIDFESPFCAQRNENVITIPNEHQNYSLLDTQVKREIDTGCMRDCGLRLNTYCDAFREKCKCATLGIVLNRPFGLRWSKLRKTHKHKKTQQNGLKAHEIDP